MSRRLRPLTLPSSAQVQFGSSTASGPEQVYIAAVFLGTGASDVKLHSGKDANGEVVAEYTSGMNHVGGNALFFPQGCYAEITGGHVTFWCFD